MKKKWFRLISVCFFLFSISYAQPVNSPFSFWIEYLLVKPNIDGSYFALVQEEAGANFTDGGHSVRLDNPFNFTSTFEVGGAFRFPNGNSLQSDFTYLFTKSERSQATLGSVGVVDGFFPTFGIGSTLVSSRISMQFFALDVLFAVPLPQWTRLETILEFGLQLMHLDVTRKVDMESLIDIFGIFVRPSYKNKNWAVGPQVGVDLSYPIFTRAKSVNLIARAAAALLVDHTTMHYEQLDFFFFPPPILIDLDNDAHYHPVTFWEMQVGFEVVSLFTRGSTFNLEVGYEFKLYRRILDWVHFTGDTQGPSFDDYSDFSWQGPYVKATLLF